MSEDDIDNVPGDSAAATAARVDRDRRAPRFSWTPAYEATFFRSLCESVGLGLRENNSFKAEAWERAAVALQATHDAYPTKSHLINKSDNARKRFRLWRGLREDPEFLYNPATKTVTATEEAWGAHIEREPLSRALRGRPFHHEQFMEILYPDVIGSGGAPKRILKPRRRTDGAPADDSEMPGTSVLNLQGDQSRVTELDAEQLEKRSGQRPLLSQTPTGSSSGSLSSQPQRQQKATATEKPAPTLASSAGTAAALTPPDETLPLIQGQGRKRRPPPTAAPQPAMSPPAPIAPVALPQAPLSTPSSPNKRRRASSRSVPVPVPIAAASDVSFLPQPASPVLLQQQQQQQALATALSGALPFLEEVVEAIKARAAPRWRELALDLFFREHADEELDLQVKISENVLSNETKAMVFCKMPDRVRQHWVGKFREMHQMNKSTANSSGPAAATT